MRMTLKRLNPFFTAQRALLLSALLVSAVIASPALALESDARQPISVLADSAEFNPDQGIAVYTGNVEIEQGSLKVKAHKITVYRNEAGEIDNIQATGQDKRVHLQQKPAPEDPVVHAYAMRIDYKAARQQVELTRQAYLKNGQDSFRGERILYHLQTRQIRAWGQDEDGQSENQDGRVKVILAPANNEAQ